MQRLSASDAFVDDHLFISEVLETVLSYDQFNCGEIAVFEVAARRYQLCEEFYTRKAGGRRRHVGGRVA